MFAKFVPLSIAAAVGLTGCQMLTNLQTPDAELARAMLVKHCVIGETHERQPFASATVERMRLAAEKKDDKSLRLRFARNMKAGTIHIHGIEDRKDGWTVVDASSDQVRDNLYFRRDTGEYACSFDEWRDAVAKGVLGVFPTTDLILSVQPQTGN